MARVKVQLYGGGMYKFSPKMGSSEVAVRACSRRIRLRTGRGEHSGGVVVVMSRSPKCR